MLTLLEIIKRSTEFLARHGVEGPRLNAELLIGHALGLGRMQLYLQFERPLTEGELAAIRPLMKRRSEREPLQYLVGMTEFAGVRLKVDRRALIPRPETELLVECAKEKCPAAPATVLDLGTGTGALALALAAHWPETRVTAVDVSPEALALAGENAAALGLAARVRLVASDWFAALPAGERFGLIVANPPYLTEAEVAAAEPEVRAHEPRGALTAGAGGLEALAVILRAAPAWLAPGAWLLLETGIAQHADLRARAAEAGFTRVESRPDLAGRDRFILAAL